MKAICLGSFAAILPALAAAATIGIPARAGAQPAPHLACTKTLPRGYVNSKVITLGGGAVLCDGGALTNSGTITVAGGDSASVEVAHLANDGTVSAPAGSTLTLTDSPGNLKGTTLTGGAWSVGVGGDLSLPGAVETLSASVTISGSGQFAAVVGNLTTITPAGTFILNQSASPYMQRSIVSAGRIVLGTAGDSGGSGDSVNWNGMSSFTMTGGSFTFLDSSACINVGNNPFVIKGGTISGYGMVTGAMKLTGKGVLSPTLDGVPTTFWMNGTFTQSGGTFEDTVVDKHGSISVGDFWPEHPVALGGTLLIVSSGERPAAGAATGDIIDPAGAALAGAFSAVENNGVAGFEPVVSGGTVSMVATKNAPPAAPAIGHAALGAGGSALVRWTAPHADGGAAVTGYSVTPHPGCACSGLSAGAGATSSTIAGLSAGIAYTFTVSAHNAVGTGVPSAASNAVTPLATQGFWLAAANGEVFGAGDVSTAGGVAATGVDPVVDIATSASAGYYLVQRDGAVTARGGAHFYGDLPARHVVVSDIVAIAPTADGRGYWLVGADGGEFAFGDARFHGSLPGLGLSVSDIVGMVAAPAGVGYLLVGADGGVFAFGLHFHGSLPGLGVHVTDIVGILPTGDGAGYVLVGADGGAFVFGHGSGFFGSLPGEQVVVDDIVGLALTPGGRGYWMAGANGSVYPFGNAERIATPAGVSSNLPIAGIAAV